MKPDRRPQLQIAGESVMDSDIVAVETWRAIPGFALYEASDLGRVRSWRRPGRGDHRAATPKILKPWVSKANGYPYVGILGRRKFAVHTLVLITFVGPRPEGMECLHGDNVRTNPRLSNLRWGTSLENKADQVAHGTRRRGERHANCRMTEDKVAEMRAAFAAGDVSLAVLSRRFGVSARLTFQICRGQRWTHLPMPDSVPPPRSWGGGKPRPEAAPTEAFRLKMLTVLAETGGNRAKAARLLGVTRNTFVAWLRRAAEMAIPASGTTP